MIIRKLNPGDSRGCIARCRALSVEKAFWIDDKGDHDEINYVARMYQKGQSFTGDTATIFEVMPPGTELMDWSDPEYQNWIDKHSHNSDDCKECGAIGSIQRFVDGNYEKIINFNKFKLEF